MRIYFALFNIYAWNIGAFYSTKYRRWYIQLIPCILCMVVVIGRRQRPMLMGDYEEEFGDQQ